MAMFDSLLDEWPTKPLWFVGTSLRVRSHVAFALLQSLRPPRWIATAIMNSLRASMSFGM